MPAPNWRKSASVIKRLLHEPYQFTFVQAVRLLQRVAVLRAEKTAKPQPLEVAQNAPPHREHIRFRSETKMAYAPADVLKIEQQSHTLNNKTFEQWRMKVAFMGLTGAKGVLPQHYSELVLQELKNRNPAFLDFLEMFNHRSISLFYRASTKYRLPIQYEKARLNPARNARDDFQQCLLSLIGLGSESLNGRLLTQDQALLFYSGLFSHQVRTSNGLKRMLSEHFELPVSIDEFQGQWQELLPDLRTRLASRHLPKGQNARLGKNVVVGRKGWMIQNKLRINIGPLTAAQFDSLKPGGKKLKALNELVKFYLGPDKDFEFCIKLPKSDLKEKVRFGDNKGVKPILGWNTWFAPKLDKQAEKEMMEIHVSSGNF